MLSVSKFGGSSVSDASQIKKIADIVKSDESRRFVVVSAPGKRTDGDNKITDLLYLLKEHIDKNVGYEQVVQVIFDRFLEIEKELGVNANIGKELEKFTKKIQTKASVDYIASRGEYLNARIIAKLLGYDFIEPKDCIKFNEKGKFLFEETNDALKEELKKHKNGVIPGFYGSTPDAKIKTFSRGGSDITGALIARAAGASVYENWTDVSGFLMADPRIVKRPKHIDIITYKELRELSYMGASVLHESAIYPARLAQIPINIRNTNEPEHKGTMIVDDALAPNSGIITGIAGNKNYSVISIYKNMLSTQTGFTRRLLSILEDYDIPVEHIPSGIDNVSLVIGSQHLLGKLGDVLDEFENKLSPDSLDVYEDVSLIATVGRGMVQKHGTAAMLFKALYEADINIKMIDQGSSEINIIVGVETKDFSKAIRSIYKAFV